MLYEIMRHCRNFFVAEVHRDTFAITGGRLDLPFLLSGQYVLLEGSKRNDGVYVCPCTELTDETFTGTVSVLAPPPRFLALAAEIEAWDTEHGTPSAYISESWNGWSGTRATNRTGGQIGWADAFASRLKEWRKI